MNSLAFVTTNEDKFRFFQAWLNEVGLAIDQVKLDIDEIQSFSYEHIAVDKAQKAYAQIGRPLFVNDSAWEIPALKGFPGAYMKFVDQWFEPEDFLRLMSGKTDRRIFLHEATVFVDRRGTKVYRQKFEGKFLDYKSGDFGLPLDKVVSMSGDGVSLSLAKERGELAIFEMREFWRECGRDMLSRTMSI